jgi:hypothetical protein
MEEISFKNINNLSKLNYILAKIIIQNKFRTNYKRISRFQRNFKAHFNISTIFEPKQICTLKNSLKLSKIQ